MKVHARRNGKFIDLDMYVDFPISEYKKGMPSVDEYAISSLSEEVYHRLIGTIAVHKRCEEPANAKLDSDLEKSVRARGMVNKLPAKAVQNHPLTASGTNAESSLPPKYACGDFNAKA